MVKGMASRLRLDDLFFQLDQGDSSHRVLLDDSYPTSNTCCSFSWGFGLILADQSIGASTETEQMWEWDVDASAIPTV